MIEYETKVLNVNVREISSKLKRLGAKKGRILLMRRWVFDTSPKRGGYVRVRNDGKKTTLTYKNRTGRGISQTEEIEIVVSDFDTCVRLLSRLQWHDKYYQESRRAQYFLKGIEFCIDSWPMIPPYLEIESSSEKKVKQGLKMLGLTGKDAGNMSVVDVYKRYGVKLHSYKTLKFKKHSS